MLGRGRGLWGRKKKTGRKEKENLKNSRHAFVIETTVSCGMYISESTRVATMPLWPTQRGPPSLTNLQQTHQSPQSARHFAMLARSLPLLLERARSLTRAVDTSEKELERDGKAMWGEKLSLNLQDLEHPLQRVSIFVEFGLLRLSLIFTKNASIS